ncbi:hypothetical protein BDV36DRAFT_248660, partial [Aspergillus pseudocaelatus]
SLSLSLSLCVCVCLCVCVFVYTCFVPPFPFPFITTVEPFQEAASCTGALVQCEKESPHYKFISYCPWTITTFNYDCIVRIPSAFARCPASSSEAGYAPIG